MSNRFYESNAIIEGQLDKDIKRAFINHLLVYNHCLNHMYNFPETEFKALRKKATDYIRTENLNPVLLPALYNEVYYQYKKFRRNVRPQKALTDVQYFTFIIDGYDNAFFTVSNDRKEIRLFDIPGIIKLETPLPAPEELGGKIIYFNISFSSMLNQYRINMYRGA